MKKLFLLLLAVFAIGMCASAQTRTVRGIVLDVDNDEPLPGVSVTGGTGYAAITDIDGVFSITIPVKTAKLTFSYVGFKTVEEAVPAKGEMLVKMHLSATNLDEVIAVAYGSAKKSSFTGSASVVKADQIENTQVTNALDAIAGRVAGVQMTNASGSPDKSSPTIRIRGITSITAENTPLIVVDGAPFNGDLNTINTHDIESMTVLKDAASNALYGARGANGVILITTKRGSSYGGAVVNFDAKWGANSRATLAYNTIDDPAMYYETFFASIYNQATYDPAIGGMGMSSEQAYVYANQYMFGQYGLGYNVYTVPDGQTLIGRDGKLNPYATLGREVEYKGNKYYLSPDNWLDEAYRTSLRQEYNFSVSSGTEKSNFYASFGYLNNEGITRNSSYERLSGRLSADYQAKSWLKVGGNASYSHYNAAAMDNEGDSANSGNIFAAATTVAPIYPLYVRDGAGNIMVDGDGNTVYDYGAGNNAGLARPVFGGNTNAIGQSILDTNSYEGNAFNGLGFVEIRFLNDFKFTSNNSFALDEARTTSVTNPFYGQYATSNGLVYKYHTRNFNYTFQQLLTWNHTFGKHNVSLLAGHESNWEKYAYLMGHKSNMFMPSNDELAGSILVESANSYTTEYNNEGWIFRGQYDFDSRYFLSASLRRDGSSRFHPDHRWGNFWSLGAAWTIDKEAWFDAPWVDMLKFKASYGEQGNDRIGNYRYVNTFQIVNSAGTPAATPYAMGNENISWEKNGNFNIGFDFSFWNGRLDGSIEGFYRKTTDMLSLFYLPSSFGFSSYYDNIGDMINGGIEIDLNTRILSGKDYSWDFNVNLTWYKNEISRIADKNKTLSLEGHDGYTSGTYFYGEGKPLYTFYMQQYAGVDQTTGKPLYWRDVKDSNGNVTGRETTDNYSEASQYLCGTALPSVYGGFGTSATFKGFDFAINFAYQIGGQVYDGDYASYMGSPQTSRRGYAIHADVLNAWTPENSTSNIPRWVFGDSQNAPSSDRFLTDASYLNLQNINFGYSLPKSLIKKLQLSKLRVYLACENVWLWSKRQGLNPMQSISGAVNNTYYAPVRTISGGINVTF